MATTKPTFAKLGIKTKIDTKTINYNDMEIEVYSYLPVSDKYDLIQATIQKSLINDSVDPLLLEAYFSLHVVYMYTNIAFTEKQKEDELKLFDALETAGIIDMVWGAIPEKEVALIEEMIEATVDEMKEYNCSFAGVFSKIMKDLPDQMQATVAALNDLSPDKFKEAQDFVKFAKEANNGMPFPKQEEEN